MEQLLHKQLTALFEPRTLAVIGSARAGKIGHQVITMLIEGGFTGKLWSVNPKGSRPEGYPDIPALKGVLDIQEDIDLAVICAPAAHTAAVLEECGKKAIPTALIFTSGFSEAGNQEGENRLKEIASTYNIRLVGPNCAGVMNSGTNYYASIEVRCLPGSIALISQSGAIGGAVLAMAEERGVGFSKFISCGNRSDLGEIEFLRYMEQDPETKAVALYLESMQDGEAFMALAGRIAEKKPLMVIKAGKSVSGSRATSSHTGSMAGSDDVFEAMVKQTGIIRIADIEEMLDMCIGFSQLPLPKGRTIAIVTNSGGPSILTADKAEELKLSINEPDKGTKARLYEFLTPYCSVSNPVDLTVEGTQENYRKTLDVLLSGSYDGAIAINVATPFLDSKKLAFGIIEAARNHQKPVPAVFLAGNIVADGIEALHAAGIPTFQTGERAANVLAKMAQFSLRSGEATPSASLERSGEESPGTASKCSGGQPSRAPSDHSADIDSGAASASGASIEEKVLPLQSPILEPDAVAFLEKEGFPFPPHIFISSQEQLGRQQSVGFPMVMKVVSPEILHKSDDGGVVLNINSVEEASEQYRRMERHFASRQFRGVMLYEQIPKAMEMIAGVTRDPDFGPVIAVGAGGIYTEMLKDISLRIAPFDTWEAETMVRELKTAPLLHGYRGSKPLAVAPFIELVVRLSRLAATYPAIRELDLNPVFLSEDGVVVGDTRILTAG